MPFYCFCHEAATVASMAEQASLCATTRKQAVEAADEDRFFVLFFNRKRYPLEIQRPKFENSILYIPVHEREGQMRHPSNILAPGSS